jgi:hypothetical protein
MRTRRLAREVRSGLLLVTLCVETREASLEAHTYHSMQPLKEHKNDVLRLEMLRLTKGMLHRTR